MLRLKYRQIWEKGDDILFRFVVGHDRDCGAITASDHSSCLASGRKRLVSHRDGRKNHSDMAAIRRRRLSAKPFGDPYDSSYSDYEKSPRRKKRDRNSNITKKVAARGSSDDDWSGTVSGGFKNASSHSSDESSSDVVTVKLGRAGSSM